MEVVVPIIWEHPVSPDKRLAGIVMILHDLEVTSSGERQIHPRGRRVNEVIIDQVTMIRNKELDSSQLFISLISDNDYVKRNKRIKSRRSIKLGKLQL